MRSPECCPSMSVSATGRSRHDVLAELLIEATATFETDRLRAKFCIQQATGLLRLGTIGREPRRVKFPIVCGGLAPWQARRVAAYIESNIGSKIRVAALAALVQLSAGHFFRAFKLSFGACPQAYVMQRRILRAQVIMASSNESLAQIALACGMCDQAHFSRTFRRFIGVQPNVWRRQTAAAPRTAPTLDVQEDAILANHAPEPWP
jgi:AraC family transcriptional regulator